MRCRGRGPKREEIVDLGKQEREGGPAGVAAAREPRDRVGDVWERLRVTAARRGSAREASELGCCVRDRLMASLSSFVYMASRRWGIATRIEKRGG